jgi:hypothetical protein
LGERKAIEKIKGGHNSTNSKKKKKKNLDKRAIHIHGRMEHNVSGYAKFYSYGSREILGSSEFTKEIDHSRRDFFGHW